MAMLGLFNKLLGLFTVDELIKGMEIYLPVWRHKLLPGNRQVLETVTGWTSSRTASPPDPRPLASLAVSSRASLS